MISLWSNSAMNVKQFLSFICQPFVLAGIITIVSGIVYVGGAWTPSHYGIALGWIGAPELGPVLGTARPITSDEWAVATPYFQIAVANRLGEWNAYSPYHETLRSWLPLPTNNWSILFKPQLWGFLFLPPEYAFSLYHFVLIASFVWGFFILFTLLGIDWRFAMLGVVLIFFSRFNQVWWVSNGARFALAPWPLVAVLVPARWYWRFILVFYAAAVWMFSNVYPPFLIGGAWAFGVLLVAFRP